MDNFKNETKAELNELLNSEVFDKIYLRKKIIALVIRTLLSIILYIIFWKYNWVKWVLVIHLPLFILNLWLVFKMPNKLKSKIEKLDSKLDEIGGS